MNLLIRHPVRPWLPAFRFGNAVRQMWVMCRITAGRTPDSTTDVVSESWSLRACAELSEAPLLELTDAEFALSNRCLRAVRNGAANPHPRPMSLPDW